METRIDTIRHAAAKIAAEKRQGDRKLASIAALVIASSEQNGKDPRTRF